MIPRAAYWSVVLQALFFSIFLFSAAAVEDWTCARSQAPCRSVSVVYDSWHAAIVLRTDDLSRDILPELEDFPGARFVEFSWGDQDYFPDPNAGVLMALKAAFWSSGSVLHVVGFDKDPGQFYPRATISELRLSAHAYDRLVGFIARSFARPPQNMRASARNGLFSFSRFYPSPRKFSLSTTCNTWVAQALQAAGLPVAPGMVISAAQLAEQLDKINHTR